MPLWHSEEDAKQKWCSHSRQPDQYSETIQVNRDASGKPVAMCIASDCMAWRWVKTNIADGRGNLTISSTDTYGFCGLAGQPKYETS